MAQLSQRCNVSILNWLEQVVPPCPHLPSLNSPSVSISPTNKRKRARSAAIASPPLSTTYPPLSTSATYNVNTRTPTGKKRRKTATEDQDATFDQEATPRQRGEHPPSAILAPPRLCFTPQPQVWEPTGSVQSATSSGVSTRSGQTSPTKELARLALGPGALVTYPLSRTQSLPPKLLAMLEIMEDIESGVGIFPERLKDSISKETETGRLPRIPHHMFAENETRDLLGPTPSVSDVMDIVEDASRCVSTGQYEDGWICGVHFPLLRLALSGKRGVVNDLLDVRITTHAKAIRMYSSFASQKLRMVDLCLVACPSNLHPADPTTIAAAAAVETLRKSLPSSSINHSDAPPLLDAPVAISIEVKTTGGDEQRQSLQVGIWQAAQWNMWSQLLEGRLLQKYTTAVRTAPSEPSAGDGGNGQDGANDVLKRISEHAMAESDRLLCTLPYLPAIFIRGHSWYLAGTSRQGEKTILWREYPIGTTQSVVGTYKIIYGLQNLFQYIRNTFWPWYLRVILEIEPNDPR
ncbi:hypothetical protein MCOR25_007567 [Pyricularia grisea]|nr:hypothetical protein MCOR25_007567 [Pyricularia grisea]